MELTKSNNLPEFTVIADIRGPYTDPNGSAIVPFPAQFKRIFKVLLLTTVVNFFMIGLPLPPASSAILKLSFTSFPYNILVKKYECFMMITSLKYFKSC